MATGGTDNQEIIVMTLNIGLKSRSNNRDESREEKKKRTIKIKNDAIAELLKAQKPHIVFLQESKKSDKIPPNYEYLFKDQASLLYKKTELELEMVDTSTFESIQQKETKGDLTKELYKARFCVATAKLIQDEEAKFLCVSWHAPYKLTHNKREKALGDMLSFVDAMCMKLKLPCIIGGDFNLSCEKVTSYLENAKLDSKFLCSECKTLPRRKDVIDFFVTSKFLQVTDVTAVAWDSLKNIEDNLDDYFDHDPIVGTLSDGKKHVFDILLTIFESILRALKGHRH